MKTPNLLFSLGGGTLGKKKNPKTKTKTNHFLNISFAYLHKYTGETSSTFPSTTSLLSIQSAVRLREFGTGLFVSVAMLVMAEVCLPQYSVFRGENKKL